MARIWIGDSITLEKLEGVSYILRRPTNKEISPGPNNWTCVLVINGRNASLKAFEARHGSPGFTIKEAKTLKKYIQAMGCDIGEWERHKDGKPEKKVAIVAEHNKSKG